jgi:hypothetical protein
MIVLMPLYPVADVLKITPHGRGIVVDPVNPMILDVQEKFSSFLGVWLRP